MLCAYRSLSVAARLDPAASSWLLTSSVAARLEPPNKMAAEQQRRGMARGRNFYIRGASNKQEISEETKELLKNAR